MICYTGRLSLDRPLSDEHNRYLEAYMRMRHSTACHSLVAETLDAARVREDAGLPREARYVVDLAQDAIISCVGSDSGECPALWCDWRLTHDRRALICRPGKRDDQLSWPEYIVTHFLAPWGYRVNGLVRWQDDDDEGEGDSGAVRVTMLNGARPVVDVTSRAYRNRMARGGLRALTCVEYGIDDQMPDIYKRIGARLVGAVVLHRQRRALRWLRLVLGRHGLPMHIAKLRHVK